MNILFICDEYPPGAHGGIGTMVQVLGRQLVKLGHQVFVAGLYSHRYGGKDYEEDQGVKVWRMRYGINLPVNKNSRLHNLPDKLPASIRRNLNGRKAFGQFIYFINDLISKESVDIIEIQDWNTFSQNIGFIVEWPEFSVPLVVKSNGSYTYFIHETSGVLDPALFKADQLLYERADALSAVSQYTAARNKKLFNIGRPIEILYNSVEIPEEPSNIQRSENKVFFSGTLVRKKGVYELIKAWNLVHSSLPDAKLSIYGKGNTASLRKLLSASSLPSVAFKKHATRARLFQELSESTIAIFPSFSECFSFAPLEAMAMGCPIINSSRSSGPELVTDYLNGSLVDPAKVESIAGKIIELMQNGTLRTTYSENGRETILKHFDIVKSAKDHIDFYTSVVNNYTN